MFPTRLHVRKCKRRSARVSAQSDQSLRSALWAAKYLKRLQVDVKDFDQPARMRKRIWAQLFKTNNVVI